MKKVIKAFDSLQNLGAYLGSVLLVLLVLLILCEIILRSFFDASTMIADEYSGYLYLAIIFLSLGYALKSEAHIRITIITARLSNKKLKIIDIFASLLALGILCFALYRTLLFTYDSYELNMTSEAVSQTPLYLTQLAMPLGIILFILALISYMYKRLTHDN